MKYLICQDWQSTSNNHAGMKFLAMNLQKLYPNEIKVFVLPYYKWHAKKTLVYKIMSKIDGLKHIFLVKSYFNKIIRNASKNSEVLHMELDNSPILINELEKLKKKRPDIKVSIMVHLCPYQYEDILTDVFLNRVDSCVDQVVTLGHTLTEYFNEKGFFLNKTCTTLHYVDGFYTKKSELNVHKPLRVLAMGNQARNQEVLLKIVKANPNIKFTICQGMSDLSGLFERCKNVNLIPFVDETELRRYMDESDISLNIMRDTIGSNVVVTSLAMGMAMICSDVGSIHDYCNKENTIFCKNSDIKAFSDALSFLNSNPDVVLKMKQSAIKESKRFTISKFYNDVFYKH